MRFLCTLHGKNSWPTVLYTGGAWVPAAAAGSLEPPPFLQLWKLLSLLCHSGLLFCSNEAMIASFFSFSFFLRLSLQCSMSFQCWPCLAFISWTPCNSAPHLFGLQLCEGTPCYTACMTCSPHFCSPFCVSEDLNPAWTYLPGFSDYLLCWDHVLCASCFVLPRLCSLCAFCSVLTCCQHGSVWLCSCPWQGDPNSLILWWFYSNLRAWSVLFAG